MQIDELSVIPFSFKDPESLSAVTCSPTDETVFAATMSVSTTSKLSIFKIADKVTENWSIDAPSPSKYLDAVFSNDGSKVFFVGS